MFAFLKAGSKRLPEETFLAGFLLATLVLAAWLGFQAVDAARSHRQTAENALRDYASISAWELSRTLEDDLDDVLDDVFGPVKRRIGRQSLPSPDLVGRDLYDAVEDEGCRNCDGFREPIALFRYEVASGRVRSIPDTFPPATLRRLADTVLTVWPLAPRGGEGFITAAPGQYFDQAVAVGYTAVFDMLDSARAVFGFVVPVEALGEFLHETYDDRQLLPQPLAGDQPNDSALSVTVRDPAGLTVFASPAQYPATLSAQDTLSADFGNWIVEATVRPDAADQLIIGGLPRSRLPFLVVLLVLTLGVGVAALVQLKRERELRRLRDDFVSGVSHELRTPLAQIRMFAELQEAGKLSSDVDRERAIAVIHRESRRLCHLVENILQFSRLRRANGMMLQRETLDLSQALVDGVEAVAPMIEARGMRVDLDARPGYGVIANRDALNRIVVNLLDNAVKYGPDGQTVSVGVDRSNGSARLSVSDQGPGVPVGDRERVWKAYRRLERDVRGPQPGTGIGLSVVAELAELHEGRAWVEDATGGGARFVVELPLANGSPEEDPEGPPRE